MNTRIGSIILCICMVAGVMAADTAPETDMAVEKEDILITENDSKAETVSTNAAPEKVNALGMPLLEDTALLVTVAYTRLSDWYHYIKEQYEYDRKGHILRRLEQGINGFENTLYMYTYDTDGRMLREDCYDADFQGKNWELDYWWEYSYIGGEKDGGGNRIERKYGADDHLLYEYVYDSGDRLLREKAYSVYNGYALYSEYEYDKANQQAVWTYYDDQGKIESRTKEEYDEAGNKLLSAQYDAEGNILLVQDCECRTEISAYYSYCRYENQYDGQGNLVRQISYDFEGQEFAQLENTYDGQGRLCREQYENEQDSYENYYYEYLYDAGGSLIQEHSFDEWSAQERTVRFLYDDRGNHVGKQLVSYAYDENGNRMPERYESVLWERAYDEKNRIVQYINYADTDGAVKQYEYNYETIGIAEEEYPYDQITIRESY